MSDDKDALIYLADVRIEELNAENAKLRHDLEEANNQAEEVCIENAKLRELVRCMAYCMQYERDCDECRMNGADGNIAEPCGCVGLLDRMRELGIEVDG